jgi:Fic family protein
MSKREGIYTQVRAMEPLMAAHGQAELTDLSCEIMRQAGSLSAQIPAAIVQQRIAQLVREMNSYYSNLIEGHKTLPRDIERALRQDYSDDPGKRANQILNRAHIEVESVMTERLKREPSIPIHSPEFLCWIHREFYSRLPAEMHWSLDRRGRKYKIEPGMLRTFEVDVGRHQPPHSAVVPAMLGRFAEFYGSDRISGHDRLAAMAAAHHRLAWIHPFGDGNGRVARLYSHACLIRGKMDALGLWSLSRSLARRRQDYFAHLSAADAPRRNDLDGRGELSDRGLGEFCLFFLRTMLDQIEFMNQLLQLPRLMQRIERRLQFEALHLKPKSRDRLTRLLKAAMVEGAIERGRVREILGLGSTAAREIIATGLREKLLDSPSEKGPLSLVFSSETLESYFPQLYQDLGG